MSSYDSVRPHEHVGRNREADLLCSLQVDDQLELHWLLRGEISGLPTLQDLVYIDGGGVCWGRTEVGPL